MPSHPECPLHRASFLRVATLCYREWLRAKAKTQGAQGTPHLDTCAHTSHVLHTPTDTCTKHPHMCTPSWVTSPVPSPPVSAPPLASFWGNKHICQPYNHESAFSTGVSGGSRQAGCRVPPLGPRRGPCQISGWVGDKLVAGDSPMGCSGLVPARCSLDLWVQGGACAAAPRNPKF